MFLKLGLNVCQSNINNKTNNFENGLNWDCKLTLFIVKEYSY
jgi:hypothetical protein